jgi:hypothetical protein
MDIRAALEREHSKVLSERIAAYIGTDKERFAELMDCLLHGTPCIVQRAAWPMSLACEAHPGLATPWLPRMLDQLDKPVHEAVHRNVVRTLQFCALPEKLRGRIIEVMFAWIADPSKPIAARASAITVGTRLVELHPELADEFRLLLEDALRIDPGPAIRSRAGKAMHRMQRTRGRR